MPVSINIEKVAQMIFKIFVLTFKFEHAVSRGIARCHLVGWKFWEKVTDINSEFKVNLTVMTFKWNMITSYKSEKKIDLY